MFAPPKKSNTQSITSVLRDLFSEMFKLLSNKPYLEYFGDLNKSFHNAIDTLCKRFWTNRQGVVEIFRKYSELVYIMH
ncbi:43_t:CDS:1, partial [Funneliformis caledonium]